MLDSYDENFDDSHAEIEKEIVETVKSKLSEKNFKLYHSIGEVAKMFDVNESLLRYWETQFPMLRPNKNQGGTRFYKKEDIEKVGLIYHLVKIKGMTLAGAKKKLTQNPELTFSAYEVLQRLENIKAELLAMRDELNRAR